MTAGAVEAAEMGGEPERDRARPGWVLERPALVAALDEAVRTSDVTLIVAAAGSGKSTLLAQWAASRATPVHWARLRLTDTDPILCGQRLVGAVRTLVDESIGVGPPDLADARVRRRLAESLALGARRHPGACLVIEDLHRADPTTVRFLAEVVDVVSRDLPVVVASRVDPHWPLSDWRLEGRLREIRQQQIDFDDEAATELVHTIAPGRLGAADAAALVERCQGWAAGLVLSGLSVRDHPDPTAFAIAFSGADHTVADYLFDEVYATLDDRERRFVLSTSVCPRFDAELAAALTGDEHAAMLLRRLADRLLLIRPVAGHPGWYRYHDLFREMLRQQLELERPGRAPALVREAAAWSAAAGDVTARCAYLAEIGEWEQIAAVAAARVRESFFDRTNRELVGCLELIPPERRDLATTLTMATVCVATGLIARARVLCDAAQLDPEFGPVHALTLDRLRCGMVEWGEPPAAVIEAAERYLAAAEPDRSSPRPLRIGSSTDPTSMRAAALAARGRARDLLGDGAAARTDLTAAIGSGDADVLWTLYARANLALVAAREGDLDGARAAAAQCQRVAEQIGMRDHPLPAAALLARAVVALRRERWHEVDAELDRCRSVCLADDRWLTLVEERVWRAERHRLTGDADAVKRCLEDIDQHPTPPPALRADVVALRARVLVDQGRAGEAARLLESAPVRTPAVVATVAALPRRSLPGGVVLTEREQEVLSRLGSRRTSAEIGAELHLSVHTVKTHQRHIYQKLGVSSRRDAIDAAEALGLI